MEVELGTIYILYQSFKKKILIIDNWGVMEGVAKSGGRKVRGKINRVKKKG